MVAINFPDSPTNGQEHSGYVWDATNNVWNRLPTLPALDLVNFSAVAPSNPQDGQFWFDTTAGKMYVYYNDGSSAQWVSTLGGLVGQTGTDGQFLIHNGTEWVASEFTSPGSVLQVVSTTKTDTFSSSSSSAVNVTGLSASITPSSTSSKILIFASIYSSASNASASFALFSITGGNASSYQGSGGNGEFNLPPQNSAWSSPDLRGVLTMANYLDSPSTTSSVTYQVQARSPGGATFYINRHATEGSPAIRGASTITLMEIAG